MTLNKVIIAMTSETMMKYKVEKAECALCLYGVPLVGSLLKQLLSISFIDGKWALRIFNFSNRYGIIVSIKRADQFMRRDLPRCFQLKALYKLL